MAVSSSSPLVAVGDEVVGLTCLLVAVAAAALAIAVAATGALPRASGIKKYFYQLPHVSD